MTLTIVPAFRSKLILEDDTGIPYTLVQPLIYDSGKLTRTITVPAGFQTDLASIPRGLWNVLPKSGAYDKAAVVHDALYQWGGVTPFSLSADAISRGDADGVLLEAMTVLGVGWWTRHVIYAGVRVGGWKSWGAYRERQAPQTAA